MKKSEDPLTNALKDRSCLREGNFANLSFRGAGKGASGGRVHLYCEFAIKRREERVLNLFGGGVKQRRLRKKGEVGFYSRGGQW